MSKPDDPIERELVNRSKCGDAAAFEDLAQRARPLCQTVARSILGDDAEAEDQVQNAVFKAWQSIDQFRQDSSFTTWICRIATNECLMLVRRRSRFPHVAIEETCDGENRNGMQFQDRKADPEKLAACDEVRVMLSRELSRVPKIFRTVLVMGEVRGLPISEIAEQLGISSAAAKSRLIRARRALRERVQRHTGQSGLASLLPDG